MKLKIYSIRDKKAEVYFTPMFLSNDAVAIRMLRGELMSPTSNIAAFPEDYSLHKVGIFDDETGIISLIELEEEEKEEAIERTKDKDIPLVEVLDEMLKFKKLVTEAVDIELQKQ